MGKPGICTECAVSLAVKDACALAAKDSDFKEFGGHVPIDIHVTTFAAPGGVIGIAVKYSAVRAYRVYLARVAAADIDTVKNFINAFDKNDVVAPFEFELEFPDQNQG